MAREDSSPSASSTLLPFKGQAGRRGSLASVTSRKDLDKHALQQVLDDIHTTASKTETLTSFHDFGGSAKPGPPSSKDSTSGGVAGLYNRFKRSVGGGPLHKDDKGRPQSSASKDSVNSNPSLPTSPANTALQKPSQAKHQSDTASLSNLSLQLSPSLTTSGDAVDFAPLSLSGSRRESHEPANEPPYRIPDRGNDPVKSQPMRRDVPQEPDNEDARLEAELVRSAMNGNTGERATAALAKVLSNDRVILGDKQKSSISLSLTDESEVPSSIAQSSRSRAPTPQPLIEESLLMSHQRYHQQQQQQQQPSDLRQPSEPVLSPRYPVRPSMPRPGPSHLPGFHPSQTSSTVDGDELGSVYSQQQSTRQHHLAPSPNISGKSQTTREPNEQPTSHLHFNARIPTHIKRRVISKEFWMKDENAKDCFSCGQAFSTFRRKHHCRTCGQIFDAKCTSLIDGRPFSQPGTIRLCKPCEAMIYGSDDDSTVFSDDAEDLGRSPATNRPSFGSTDLPTSFADFNARRPGNGEVATPSIGIPASRRTREAKRRSAVIEFDAHPTLARPSSSRSLISLSARPRSSSHRRHQSRHHFPRNFRLSTDERGPFYQEIMDDPDQGSQLPAFHNDNIIDPDLAPFLSDDGTDEDEQPNIMSAFSPENTNVSSIERERTGLGGILVSAMKKGRSRLGDKSSTRGVKDDDAVSISSKHAAKLTRKRNSSMGSLTPGRPSPRRSRSNMLLKTLESDAVEAFPSSPSATPILSAGTKMICSSAMHGMNAPPVELNHASLEHVQKLLSQLLGDAKIPSPLAWEKALLPILLRCADDVDPDVQLQNDDMDIRHYIKLKKVTGGRPGDTSYVSGIVFSKNVALKSMARHIRNPRIAIITFAIEYARHQAHFMSLDPILAQEKEYLQNLVARIIALKPQVLLVQRNVSGYALRLLEEAGISVAYNIKDSVLAAVARVTQSSKISSVDKLTMDPSRLGYCESFDVRTYAHNGVRKSYIYLSGCQPDLGCTIVLRGAETRTLRKIKRITEFMCFVVYNLRLETNLMRDEFVSIPSNRHEQLEPPESLDTQTSRFDQTTPTRPQTPGQHRSVNRPSSKGENLRPPIMTTTNGMMGITAGEPIDASEPSLYADMEEECRARILSASPFVVFMQPYLLTQIREHESRLTKYKKLRDQYAAADEEGGDDDGHGKEHFSLVKPEMVGQPASKDQPKSVREYLHAVYEAQLERVSHSYENSRRLWESFMAGNHDPWDPFSHQTIVVLYSMVSSINSAPCDGPQLLGIEYYAGYNQLETFFEQDCTLGQFIEDVVFTAYDPCKECDRKLSDHHRQYVHGYGQLSISIQRQPARIRGLHNTILMWSSCRICRSETMVMPMSTNTWKYSFAKYLELSFWSSPLHPRAGVCQHDIHKDFLRCFGFQDFVVRVQYDPVEIYDVIVPRPTITWKVESDLTVKNEQYNRFALRLNNFIDSVQKRLDSIHIEPLETSLTVEAQEKRAELRQRAEDDRQELLHKLQQKYSMSRYYELIPLNRALRLMDEKAIAWDEEFVNFERNFFPSETDIRKIAAQQLKRLFLDEKPTTDAFASDTSDTEEGTELSSVKRQRSPKPITEQMESEKVQDVINSVVEEHKVSLDDNDEHHVESLDRNADDGEDGAALDRMISPQQGQARVVEREDVKHLDLAVAKSPDDITTAEQSSPASPPKQPVYIVGSQDDPNSSEPFATHPRPLGPGVLEKIEQMRNERAAAGLDNSASESKIPRLADLKKADGSPRPVRPSLGERTRSTPSHVHHLSPDLTVDQPSIDAVAKYDGNLLDKRLSEKFHGGLSPVRSNRLAPSLIPRSVPTKAENTNPGVSVLAKHFEQMSREFEKERLREKRQRAAKSRQARANPLASSRPVVEVFRDAREAVGERSFDNPMTSGNTSDEILNAEGLKSPTLPPQGETDSVGGHRARAEDGSEVIDHAETSHAKEGRHLLDADTEPDLSDVDYHGNVPTRSREVSDAASGILSASLLSPTSIPDLEQLQPELSISEQKKNAWFKVLADFWSKRSASGWSPLEYPLHNTEHVFEDSDIIVREDEPSSVIALALASADYLTKVKEFRSHPQRHNQYKHCHTTSQASNTVSVSDDQQEAIEASLLSARGTHMKYSFNHGKVSVQCKIFYAESFDALRRKCGIADRFVESMSRCFKFDSKGGKTKSLFLKTLDNRFIVKSLQEVELKAFTKFAPDYFQFMGDTLFRRVPSVIAKMFGLFQVMIRNPATGMDFSYYLLVMENLFYERNPNRRFDLKGSMRNRKIESTGQPDEVLLDENLVETIFEKPLFVREHARKLLQASVWNDTLWLCKQNVMDYSLMAGFDDERKELIVGIIDCIRTYTWDKKLESWIKDRGKNKPTITSPKDYRNRFRVSMMQYVLQAPNCWHQFQAQMAQPRTLKQEDAEETATEGERIDNRKSEG
ncbi:hypothetical protein K431DRAFT_284459 [Polychaeton citri CBS 116435]|uniref:1-phosphatidylinositol-3-phosphate 5-kinase n=1 Tax=Polychaeton citri CBS 116435 TaxID=1314669 RepID=A0A9P4UQE8_9PEZI|nr:hypothetical protein K431DRAFT_284459 [Polychaeton citri CBS 116435]